MVCFRGGVSTVMIAIYGPLILMTMTMMNADHSESHELRPSDHGLEYQTNTPSSSDSGKSPPPEMMSFFGNSSSTSSDVAMPKALNSNSNSSSSSSPDDDTSWWNNAGRGGGGGKSKDHVRDVLLVGSIACGLTGVVLLVASALLYVFKFRKQRSPPPPSQQPPPPLLALPSSAALSCHDNDSGNKLQIVVRDSF